MNTSGPVPPSPGGRRKGPKNLPRLPLSAFSPPNTGASDSFPLPPSPSTVHPDRVVDASVSGVLAEWKQQTGGSLKQRIKSIVVKAEPGDLEGYVRLFCDDENPLRP